VTAIRRGPRPPLIAVHGTQLAVGIGPFIPDGYAMLVQKADIRVALQEPEQLIDDRLEVNLLGRQQREAAREVETQLRPEYAQSARPGAIALAHTVMENVLHQVEILAHAVSLPHAR